MTFKQKYGATASLWERRKDWVLLMPVRSLRKDVMLFWWREERNSLK